MALARSEWIWADADDEGFKFLLPFDDLETAERGAQSNDPQAPPPAQGGLCRHPEHGHLVTIVGRGGAGKSIFALQLVIELLRKEYPESPNPKRLLPGAFYFTLEAQREELKSQFSSFSWGRPKSTDGKARPWLDALRIESLSSPIEDLNTLIQRIRHTVARELAEVNQVVAIVIDALGGIEISPELRYHLAQLKELAESHRTFVFLLTEDHIFQRFPEVEHYSQTVLHLVHDPVKEPPRRIYIQKARTQRFRAGIHMLRFDRDRGLQVYPSINARSAFAHDLLERYPPSPHASFLFRHTNPAKDEKQAHPKDVVELASKGAVIFLMGPPGTFKQTIATSFCAGAGIESSTLYVSFKADQDAVQNAAPKGMKVYPYNDKQKGDLSSATWFLDARSPIKTPEEILGDVSMVLAKKEKISRAVVWGLRRLADMPFFAEGRSVQFLEALVTLLKARRITSLLVDWPDVERANTLPVVDLSHYILLTRQCKGRHEFPAKSRCDEIWETKEVDRAEVRHAALLRVQRDVKQFHRNTGYLLQRIALDLPDTDGTRQSISSRPETVVTEKTDGFENLWDEAGREWERDPGLR